MAMLRFFRLRSVQRWPEDWMRDGKVIDGQALSHFMAFGVRPEARYEWGVPAPLK